MTVKDFLRKSELKRALRDAGYGIRESGAYPAVTIALHGCPPVDVGHINGMTPYLTSYLEQPGEEIFLGKRGVDAEQKHANLMKMRSQLKEEWDAEDVMSLPEYLGVLARYYMNTFKAKPKPAEKIPQLRLE